MLRHLLIALVCPLLAFAQSTYFGDIVGRVVDSRTKEDLFGANVRVVELPAFGAAADSTGSFRISRLPVGTYSLQVTMLGYEARVITNVVVTTGRAIPVSLALDESAVGVEGVTVRANYFGRGQQLSPISTNLFDRSEVLRLPGSIQDVQRVVQNLPGVASSTDNINELIVRGGAPYENLTVMDGMEIPSINHYSNQMNSAGPINMVNADMVEDVQFSAGGFPAQYGDKVSSIMNLTMRQGDRTVGFASKSGFNMAGIGLLFEGGIGDRGSYIVSARNSLLEFVEKIVGLGAISLTAIPRYWDTQGKFVYDLSSSRSLALNFLYGDSRITFDGSSEEADELRAGRIDSSSVGRMDPVTKQYAVGLSLRTLYGKEGFDRWTLYSQGTSHDITIYDDFYRREFDAQGEVADSRLLGSSRFFSDIVRESFLALKYELTYQVLPAHRLTVAGQAGTTIQWKDDVFIAADTVRFDLDRDGLFETGPILLHDGSFSQELKFGDASKFFASVSDAIALSPRLTLTLGLRFDRFTYSDQSTWSPRASLSYQLFPPTTTLTVAAGRYTQSQPLPFYGDISHSGVNRFLPHLESTHYVLGAEHLLGEGMKMSLETYYKTYRNIAVEENLVMSAIDTFHSDRNLTIGERRAYGLELFIQQKQVEDWYGTLSLSWSRAFDKDIRRPTRTAWYPSEFDYPVILTLIGGTVVKGVRSWLDDSPFFLKYPSYILPLSDEMELSFKYRYQTGRPYTPHEYVAWKQVREGGLKWSAGAWVETDRLFGERYSDYRRVDIQWLSRYYFRSWNITVFISIQNLFNSRNVFYEELRSDGTKQTVYQFAFFPVGGVEIEF